MNNMSMSNSNATKTDDTNSNISVCMKTMSTSDSCKDGASESNNDDVCEVVGKLTSMKTDDEVSALSICAKCGKEGDNLKSCAACKLVKYCNRECQIAHRPQHKKVCRKRVAELHDAKLFKQPPPAEDCPICFERLPTLDPTGKKYMACCGKVICSGCIHAPVYADQGNIGDIDKQNECPFCRTLAHKSNEECLKRLKKRVEAGDAISIYNVGGYHREGINGYPVDYTKALELWHQAGELGYANAYRYWLCLSIWRRSES